MKLINIKRHLSVALSFFMATSFVSASTTSSKENQMPKSTVSINSTPWVQYIPRIFAAENIYINGDQNHKAYCYNEKKDSPSGQTFSLGSIITDETLLAIMYHGFPNNASGLQEKHNLNDSQARYFTQVALWNHINEWTSGGLDSYNGYYDELKQLGANKDMGPVPELSTDNSSVELKYNESLNLQESHPITISSTVEGSFTFPSDANIWSVDIDGNKKDTFNAGSQFKIQSTKEYSGSKNITINAQLKKISAQIWLSPDPAVQNIIEPLLKATTPHSLDISVKADTGTIMLSKLGEEGEALAGVEFGLFDSETATNPLSTSTTDDKGTIIFNNLTIGRNYYIKELKTLDGFVLDSKMYEVPNVDKNTTFSLTNKRIRGQIKIIKVDNSDNATPIPNTEFEIYDSNNDLVETLLTDEKGEALSSILKYGSYTIKESKAAEGYILDETPRTIDITNNNDIHSLTVGNNLIHGKISILKTDLKTNKPLEGVTFEVRKESDDSLVSTIITDNMGLASTEDLPYGSYYILETQTLEGYAMDETRYPVSIDEDGKVYEFEITNKIIEGELNFQKTDAETGKGLAGATMLISGNEERNADFKQEITSSKDGNTRTLEYGKYKIEELFAPEGYTLSKEIVEFEITEDGQVIVVNFTNAPILDVLPDTSGTPTWVLLSSGIALIGISLMLLLKKKKYNY